MIEIVNIGLLAGVFSPDKPLRGKELAKLPSLPSAYLRIRDGRIDSFGTMQDRPAEKVSESYDAKEGFVLPAWCDSHTHLVFAASRESEFVDKLRGMSYAEIAARGGGILNSANRVGQMDEDELYRLSWRRMEEIMVMGTGAVEIKSGYGLTLAGELKMLRVIRRIRENSPIPVKATFLGAHAIPETYRDKREEYIKLIIGEMLPEISRENLADYIDVFCEQNFFTPEETEKICRAGHDYGLKARIHANQLSVSGGVQAGIAVNAISVDHLESMDHESIRALAQSETIGTLLPTAAFFLRMPFPPARQIIDEGAAVALASDYNPGSSPSGNMNLVVSMGCIGMRMLPGEAINAATINGAFAMELSSECGSIAKGKRANIILTKPISSLDYLPYAFGASQIHRVMIGGKWV